jgi:hypothetical protein
MEDGHYASREAGSDECYDGAVYEVPCCLESLSEIKGRVGEDILGLGLSSSWCMCLYTQSRPRF